MTSTAGRVRPPAVAGTFYPADASSLREAIDHSFANARGLEGEGDLPKALIVPHAAYAYSGPVAASGYRTLAGARGYLRRVVLLGPSHFFPLDGVAVPEADAFATPFGPVRIEGEARALLASSPHCIESDAPHAGEHSLEVQVPFLQTMLGDFTLVPLAVGLLRTEDLADLIETLWGGVETLIVVSTDLSHYLDHDTAVERDRRTADAILARRHQAIADVDACGAFAVRGLLRFAYRRGLRPELLDLRTSGDTAGDRRRVVGYGAFTLG